MNTTVGFPDAATGPLGGVCRSPGRGSPPGNEHPVPDVPPEEGAVEGDLLGRFIGQRSGPVQVRGEGGHPQDPTSTGHQPILAVERGSGVEYDDLLAGVATGVGF